MDINVYNAIVNSDPTAFPNNYKVEDLFKDFERVHHGKLDVSQPILIRLDGKNFSSFSKFLGRGPFNEHFSLAMRNTAEDLVKEIQGARFAYVASDEITVVVYRKTVLSQVWFDGRTDKVVSVAAAYATAAFIKHLIRAYESSGAFESDQHLSAAKLLDRMPCFDGRAFNVPESLIRYYMISRVTKTYANATHMLARMHMSHKMCENKSVQELNALIDGWNHWEKEFREILSWDFTGVAVYPVKVKQQIKNPNPAAVEGEMIEVTRTQWQRRGCGDFRNNNEWDEFLRPLMVVDYSMEAAIKESQQ